MIKLNKKNLFNVSTDFQKKIIDVCEEIKKSNPNASFKEINEKVQQRMNYDNLMDTELDDTKLYEKLRKKFGDMANEVLCDLTPEAKKLLLYKDSSRQTISETLQLYECGLPKIPQTKNSKERLDKHHIADTKFNAIEYTLKYTKEQGGAQNNQFKDVEYFLEKKGALGGAILDGDFWDDGRREILKKKYPLSHIYSTEEFIEMRNSNEI